MAARKGEGSDDIELDGLSDRQRKALLLLARGMNLTEVARELKTTKTTVWRWRHDNPAFQAYLTAWTDADLNVTLADLATAGAIAVKTLVDIAQDPEESASERRACAESLLDRIGATKNRQVTVASEPEPQLPLTALLSELASRALPEEVT
jgi:transcriptional regulator with XRE-family HTH domain